MREHLQNSGDFEATIRIFSESEGGRHTPPRNGIRWDFCYAEDDPKDGIWMIWPNFLSADGNSLPEDEELPISVLLPAKMFILVDAMRMKVHRKRVKVGGVFYCHEGSKRVAVGTITKIINLNEKKK